MKMWKRTLISIFRKPAQSILMFLIIFLLGNVLFASIAIKQTSENVRLEMRARVPSYMTIKSINESHFEKTNVQIEETAKFLENNENVKNIHVLDLAKVMSFKKEDENNPYYDPEYPYEVDYNVFSLLENVNESVFEYKMLEGRYYTQEELDEGKRVIVLSDNDRYVYSYDEDGNNIYYRLKVGDKITLQLYDYKVEEEWITDTLSMTNVKVDYEHLIPYELEIIGVYESKKYKPYFKDYENIENHITNEISKKCYEEMKQLQEIAFDNHNEEDRMIFKEYTDKFYCLNNWIERIKMTTNGLDATEQLEKQLLENVNYPKSYYAIDSANEDYIYIQAPLENLDALANVALWASVVLIVVLLNLVSILFIRNRTKEIGILISMGERKLKILGQFVGEILLVGLLATSCSMITGNYFGEIVSTKFMEIQIDADYEMQYQEENPDAVTQLDLLETYKVELDSAYIISIYGASAVLLALSSALPIFYILKMKPKNVLM